MVREVKGWSCAFCGYHSTSTAAKSHVKRHIEIRHMGVRGDTLFPSPAPNKL